MDDTYGLLRQSETATALSSETKWLNYFNESMRMKAVSALCSAAAPHIY